MIKFFRHIRKSLLSEGKTGKYLKYAIGEIVLVVIGILIALQINNWNEKRKINNEIESVFTLLVNELETNIHQSNNFIAYGYFKDSIQTLFNQNKVTPEMIKNEPNFVYRDFGTRTIKFLDDRLIEVIASEKQLPSRYEGLIPGLKLLKSRIDEHRFWESRALDYSRKKIEDYVDRFTWYNRTDSLSLKKHIKHALTDTIYRNTVNRYTRLQLNENVWYASLMRTSSVALLWQIKQIQGLDETLTIREFLNDLGLKPLSEHACSDKPYKVNDIDFKRSVILYNNTNEPITYYSIDETGKRYYHEKVPANKFLVNYERGRTNRFIEYIKDDECIKIFKQNKEDYLVFE